MICPNCQNEQIIGEKHFGALYTCSSCQAVYFINFEGRPEFGDMNEEPPADALEGLENFQQDREQPTQIASLDQLQAFSQPEPMEGLEPLVDSALVTETSSASSQGLSDMNFTGDLDMNQTVSENPFQLQNNLDMQVNPEPARNAQEEADLLVKTMKPATAKSKSKTTKPESFANIAQEISNFANTDSQLSGMNYDLLVTGIDNLETKNLFREAIEDSKFSWDAFEIMKSLKNGQVQIYKISPAKAYLLAKRLQFLDIEKKWKQNVLS